MKYRFSKLPVHWIMLPVFFILHSVNEYYGLLSSKIVFRYLGYYILFAVLLFTGGRLLFKSYKKSAVWTTTLLLVFFFWGAVHDFLKGLGLPAFFTSYSLLLPILFISLLFLTWRLWKRAHTGKSTVFLNLVFLVLIIVDLAQITYKWVSSVDENDLSRNNPPLQIDIKPIPDALKPDIFFIVFDEYASSLSLKKYFNFDNHALDSMMKSNGFYVAEKAKSNYNVTPLSVSSTLNLQYFQDNYEDFLFDAKKFQQGLYTLQKSLIPKFFRDNGYSVFNFGLDPANERIAPVKFAESASRNILFSHTFLGRLAKDILWNFSSLSIFEKLLMGWEQKNIAEIEKHRQKISFNFLHLINEMSEPSVNAKFVYAHMLIPHAPFCLDRNGKSVEMSSYGINELGGYIEQIMYTNKLIERIVQFSKSSGSRSRVVIIEGDHGFRGKTPIEPKRETQFMNLNTIYFSDGDYGLLYDNISPVNVFRIVLNKYFGQQFPMLKDSSIYVR